MPGFRLPRLRFTGISKLVIILAFEVAFEIERGWWQREGDAKRGFFVCAPRRLYKKKTSDRSKTSLAFKKSSGPAVKSIVALGTDTIWQDIHGTFPSFHLCSRQPDGEKCRAEQRPYLYSKSAASGAQMYFIFNTKQVKAMQIYIYIYKYMYE